MQALVWLSLAGASVVSKSARVSGMMATPSVGLHMVLESVCRRECYEIGEMPPTWPYLAAEAYDAQAVIRLCFRRLWMKCTSSKKKSAVT